MSPQKYEGHTSGGSVTRLWLAAGTQSEAAHVRSRWTSVLRKPGCLSARPGRRGPRQAARLRSRIRRPALHAHHLGLSPRILGRWGRKPKSRIVGPRKQGAWGSDGTPAGHPHSGAAPATVVPPPAPGRPPPHPPVIRRHFKSPLGQGGIRMLSRRWRAKRAPPWTAGASGQVDRSRKAEGSAGQEAREATGAHAVSAKAGCTCGPAARRAAAPFRPCPAALSRGTQGALTGRPPPREAPVFSASALHVPAWAGFRSS